MQNENNKNETLKESKTSPWLDWAVKLQAIAQAGLTYGKDVYDRERYEQIRDIAAEMISLHSGISKEKVVDLFCSETGYQTPKLDTRAAVFQDGKILLVKENNGTWSLPGGWVDVDVSVHDNIIKEVKEESGLDVTVDTVIAIQDREKHNQPVYAWKVCKVFALCSVVGGSFEENIETSEENFPNVCTTHSFEDTIHEIKRIQEAGLELCTGGIVGMGETWKDRLSMAFTLAELGIRSIPINILIPVKGTPFGELEPMTQEDILRTVAILRYINPKADVRIAAGRNYFKDGGGELFLSGVNAALTGNLLTTGGSSMEQDRNILEEKGYILKKKPTGK